MSARYRPDNSVLWNMVNEEQKVITLFSKKIAVVAMQQIPALFHSASYLILQTRLLTATKNT